MGYDVKELNIIYFEPEGRFTSGSIVFTGSGPYSVRGIPADVNREFLELAWRVFGIVNVDPAMTEHVNLAFERESGNDLSERDIFRVNAFADVHN